MRCLAGVVILVVGCLLLPGCALFGKKSGDKQAPASGSGGGGTPPAKFPGNTDPLLNGGSAAQGKSDAVLAGRVIDNFSKPPSNTSIRLVSVDGKEAANPTEVSVDANGYFTILGLKSGASYKLQARGKNGEHVVAGITYTKAPNLTVVIQVKEDFANATTPDVQGTPAFQKTDPKTSSLGNTNNPLPTMGMNASRGSDIEMPAVTVPVPRAAPPPVPVNQGWVPGPNVALDNRNIWPPPLDIPNPAIKQPPPALLIPKVTPTPTLPPVQAPFPPASGSGSSRLDGPARVPSCVLVGKQLVNFALSDVNGEPYEFKSKRQGRLVLLDFWSTNCIPCRESIPVLKQLQARYGNQGLEVIGIAVESMGTAQEQAYRVNSMIQRLQINYRQLLSTGTDCPVRTQFQISSVPTLILVDQNGWILWRNNSQFDELERRIQQKLAAR